MVYLPVLVASVLLMLPGMMRADSPGRAKATFAGSILVVLVGQALLAVPDHPLFVTIAALVVFFTGFNLLEATLPSLISKFAPAGVKGTAVGVYSSVQFLGTFVGGACGGWLSQRHGAYAVFAFGLVLTALWFVIALGMSAPPTMDRVAP
jgi:MFS family permease